LLGPVRRNRLSGPLCHSSPRGERSRPGAGAGGVRRGGMGSHAVHGAVGLALWRTSRMAATAC